MSRAVCLAAARTSGSLSRISAASTDTEIRAEAARHRLCPPPQILRKLASDEHWDVREGVAESRAGCDPDILAELAADDATAVRRAAQNALRAQSAR